jgi:8-oxo-dGTP pyrophosphatase MutT (NUDIX family)
MAPQPRREWPVGFNPAHIRHAAGLLAAFPIDGQAHVVLTVRSDAVRHGGQVSLPGGVAEAGETYEDAALREAEEEVSLAPGRVRIVGALTPLDIPVSGFRLHPIVGTLEERPTLSPADAEVARILEVPVEQLFDPGRRSSIVIRRGDREIVAPAFRIDDVHVWGATAMVLAEFLTVIGWDPDREAHRSRRHGQTGTDSPT